MSPVAPAVDRADTLAIAVGGVTVRVRTTDPAFVDMLEVRYACFIAPSEPADYEFDVELITTAPGVLYRVTTTDGVVTEIDTPAKLPDAGRIELGKSFTGERFEKAMWTLLWVESVYVIVPAPAPVAV